MKRDASYYSSLFEINPLPILVYDAVTFKIIEANTAAVVTYGYSKNEIIDFSFLDLFYDTQESVNLKLHQNLNELLYNTSLGTFTHQTKSGELLEMQLNGNLIQEDGINLVIVVCQEVDPFTITTPDNKLLNSVLDVLCTIDGDGIFKYVSAAALNHWGYTPSELEETSFMELVVEEDLLKSLEICNHIKSSPENKTFKNRYKKKDGGIAYNLWSIIWDAEIGLAYCVARDGNEVSLAEDKILQSELRFKALVQDGYDLISILNEEGIYTYVSPSSIPVLGMDPSVFTGRSPLEFVHPGDVERLTKSLENIFVEKRIVLEPFRFINGDNEWRWVETVLTNMLDNPSINGLVTNSRDVTDKIEERHKQKLLESVITNTTDAILITDGESLDFPGPKIIFVNDAFTTMTGYKPEEVIGQSPRILQGINSNKEDLAKLGRSLREYKSTEITVLNYKKDGTEFWVNFAVTPIANELGIYTHWIGVQRDVTAQKMIERENELLKGITKVFKEEQNFVSATTEVCKLICDFGKFDWIELWTSSLDKSQMHLFSHYLPSAEDQKLHKDIKSQNAFNITEGLAGKVWNERTLIYLEDVANSEIFLRSNYVNKIGLKAVLGIPLLFNNEVMGVLKIGTKQNSAYLKTYGPIFERLEHFIGSELNRKKLENDLNHLFDAVPDILCLVDFKGRFLKINKAGSDILGYDLEEIINAHLSKFVHPDDKDKLLQHLTAVEEGQNTFEFESRYLTKKGAIIWLSWYCNASFAEELLYVTGKNITTEKNLRELNRQAATLARIGNGEINLLNHSIFWSDEIHQIFETDPKTFIPTLENSLSFYREDFRPIVSAKVNECKISGENFDFEAVLITSKKKEIWVRLMGVGEFSNGRCIRIYGSIQDINERKEAEIRLQSLADNLPGVVFQYLLYPDGTDALKFVTKGSKEIWGFSAEKVFEDNSLIWKQVELSGDLEKVKQSILDSVLTRNKWNTRFRYVMPSGEIRTHLGTGTPIYLTDGTILFNSLVLDVTNQAENEQLLEQVSRLARIGSWEYDFATNGLYWSEMVHEIAATTPENYYPEVETSLEFFTEPSRAILQSKITDCMKNGVSVDFEAQITNRNQKKKWIRVLASAEMQHGRCKRIYGSIQNINRSKSLELRITEILGSISDGFYAIDNDWKFTYFNKEAETLLQVNEKEIIGKKLWDIFPDIVGTRMDEIYHTIAKTNLPETFEFFFTANQKWYEISAYPSAGGIAVYFKNIDERRTATEQFQKLFAEKNKILESIGDVFFALDNNWTVTYWNRHAEETLNIKKESIIGRNVWQEFPSAIDGVFYKQYYKAIETKQPVIFDTFSEVMKAWFEVSIFPNEDGLSIFLKDITLKKEGNIELLKANERFEKVTEATDDVIWDWDISNQTYYRSKAIERFFGKSASKLFTSNDFWVDNFHPQDLEMIQTSVKAAIEDPTCTRWELEYRIINEDQVVIYIADRGVIIRDSDGKAFRMVGAMTDISEQKNLEFQLNELNKELQQYTVELERSNKELEQFAFVASHDLQEPLRMVSSFMDQLKRKYSDQLDEKAHQYIYFATDGAKRMKQIILDLLDYSRASKPSEGTELVNLNDILDEFMQLRRKLITEKKAVINSQTLPTLLIYKAPITQVFHCLLDNSLKYTREERVPVIDLEVHENELEYTFSIKDNGIGVDSQFFDKIFIIFQRLHNNDDYAGTGIGLSIAKRHLELLGGRIWIDSKVGEGTTFYFTIPKNR
ncbi:PAS domain S-box protein [Flavobacterium antarcticum]|uniref:PAS domain S-box protein n=1 Tax=Flavobacterium antarcticum TaxID=271155 RepID=UPI0003B62457|nr:PAS domain S-box protein [Flavobacterium antarcticum]